MDEKSAQELMTETRRSLTAKVLKYREQASHPYIKRLEVENTALKAELDLARQRIAVLLQLCRQAGYGEVSRYTTWPQ